MMAADSLDPRIRIRAALRCDGIGRLDCAEDAVSGGRLAVRWLPLDANGDAAVKACARLPEHPMLPRIRQTGQVGGSAFVAMDFPEGALLSTRAGERLEVDAVIRLGAQLSGALATVHAQGVVHGEVSTDSVLLVEPDHAYLWDMPLVIANRLTDRRGENRLMQNLVKTAPFLAPERARGDGASQASDVYALGVVLCVSAGAPLPTASTTLAVVHQVAQGAWTPRVPMVLPEPYRSMLARMVSADPALRPSADEVARVFGELPTPAALPTVPEFPVVKLPPELLAAADALLRRPSKETPKVPAEPGLSRENPVLQGVDVGAVTAEARARAGLVAEAKPAADEPAVGQPRVAEAAPKASVAAPAAVQLRDNLSVSHELAQAGAAALSDEEVEAIQRSRRQVIVVAAGLGTAIVALATVAFVLATSHANSPAPRPVVVQPPTAPVKAAPVRVEDELAPLLALPQPQVTAPRVAAQAPKPAFAPAKRPVPQAPASAPEVSTTAPAAAEEAVAPAPTSPPDFEFLDTSADAPTAELKRPSW